MPRWAGPERVREAGEVIRDTLCRGAPGWDLGISLLPPDEIAELNWVGGAAAQCC